MAPNMDFTTNDHESRQQSSNPRSLSEMSVIIQNMSRAIYQLQIQQELLKKQIGESQQIQANETKNDKQQDKSSPTGVREKSRGENKEASNTEASETSSEAINDDGNDDATKHEHWTGYLDFIVKSGDENKTVAVLPCKIHAPYVKDEKLQSEMKEWPVKHTVELIPNRFHKQIMSKIGTSEKVCFKPTMSDWRAPKLPDDFSHFIGYIDLKNSDYNIKVMFVHYASLTNSFLALIPNDQQSFLGMLDRINREIKEIEGTLAWNGVRQTRVREHLVDIGDKLNDVDTLRYECDRAHGFMWKAVSERNQYHRSMLDVTSKYEAALEEIKKLKKSVEEKYIEIAKSTVSVENSDKVASLLLERDRCVDCCYMFMSERNDFQNSLKMMTYRYEKAVEEINKLKKNDQEDRKKAGKDLLKLTEKYNASMNEINVLKKEIASVSKMLDEAYTRNILLERVNEKLKKKQKGSRVRATKLAIIPENKLTLTHSIKETAAETFPSYIKTFGSDTKKVAKEVWKCRSKISSPRKKHLLPHFTDSSLLDRLDALKQQREGVNVADKLKDKETKLDKTKQKTQQEELVTVAEVSTNRQAIENFNRKVDLLLEKSVQQTESTAQIQNLTVENPEPQTKLINLISIQQKISSKTPPTEKKIKPSLPVLNDNFQSFIPARYWYDSESVLDLAYQPFLPAQYWSSTDPLLPMD